MKRIAISKSVEYDVEFSSHFVWMTLIHPEPVLIAWWLVFLFGISTENLSMLLTHAMEQSATEYRNITQSRDLTLGVNTFNVDRDLEFAVTFKLLCCVLWSMPLVQLAAEPKHSKGRWKKSPPFQRISVTCCAIKRRCIGVSGTKSLSFRIEH